MKVNAKLLELCAKASGAMSPTPSYPGGVNYRPVFSPLMREHDPAWLTRLASTNPATPTALSAVIESLAQEFGGYAALEDALRTNAAMFLKIADIVHVVTAADDVEPQKRDTKVEGTTKGKPMALVTVADGIYVPTARPTGEFKLRLKEK